MATSASFLFKASPDLAISVKVARIRRRWRQVDLAAVAGVRPHDVSRLECGKQVFAEYAQRVLQTLGLEEADDA